MFNDYSGTYEEYLASCGDDHLDADAASLRARREKRSRRAGAKKSPEKSTTNDDAKKRKDLEPRRDLATAALEKTESRIAEIDELFCRPGFFEETADNKTRALQSERDKLNNDLEAAMREWEEIESQLES